MVELILLKRAHVFKIAKIGIFCHHISQSQTLVSTERRMWNMVTKFEPYPTKWAILRNLCTFVHFQSGASL